MAVQSTDFIGPLTTVFTPPPGCLATATYNENGIWAPSYSKSLSPVVLYGATGQAPDLVCYPPKYTLNYVYSPGICPSGTSSHERVLQDSFNTEFGTRRLDKRMRASRWFEDLLLYTDDRRTMLP